MKELGILWPDGWNLTKGGDGLIGYTPTEEILEKLRKPKPLGFAEKVSKHLKGIPKTKKQKRKISETKKLKKFLFGIKEQRDYKWLGTRGKMSSV